MAGRMPLRGVMAIALVDDVAINAALAAAAGETKDRY